MLGGFVLSCFTASVSYVLLQMVFHLARPKIALTVSRPAVTMRAKSSWNPIDLFHDSATLELCAAISSRDYLELDRLLKQPRDLNQTGKSGITVLHWAYFENDLVAFTTLLKAGASPDIVFTENVETDFYGFFKDSTLPLDSAQHRGYGMPFFEASLPYIRTPNHLAPFLGRTILHAYIAYCSGASGPPVIEMMGKILETGVDPNIVDADGATAAGVALYLNMIDECIFLLEAGKNTPNAQATNAAVRELLITKLKGNQIAKNGRAITAELHALQAWLDANPPPTP
ncbi:Ankyrin repeats (3 copies) [Aureliella helgolandensis]|uniref:Ankyrin repeats (3 copies) n=2 Tax=Aureliella helgolandensis TaxID=2527968 RepID=A0A518G4Q2_9BACT|nr:Ankyrin repeats (3 copies) [Aureliella helgolandensis]